MKIVYELTKTWTSSELNRLAAKGVSCNEMQPEKWGDIYVDVVT